MFAKYVPNLMLVAWIVASLWRKKKEDKIKYIFVYFLNFHKNDVIHINVGIKRHNYIIINLLCESFIHVSVIFFQFWAGNEKKKNYEKSFFKT